MAAERASDRGGKEVRGGKGVPALLPPPPFSFLVPFFASLPRFSPWPWLKRE